MEVALRVLEDYASRGYDVGADVYPYTASSTGLSAILPPWVREGGFKSMIKRLKDPEVLSKIKHEVEEVKGVEWSLIYISYSKSHNELEGLSVSEISKQLNLEPLNVIVKLLVDDEGSTSMISHGMCEEDVITALKNPLVAIGSDGSIRVYGEGKPHPRNYGAFPRVISRYVRELRVLSLTEAIRKMTSLPARKLRLWDRGIIRPGMKADLVVFNFKSIADTATYQEPHNYPKGIRYVIVNGELVVEDGKHTGSKPGVLIRRV